MHEESFKIIAEYKYKLESLKGQTIEELWVSWDSINDEWFNDLPVILKFKTCQLELCAYKTNQYAVTFDHIDLLYKCQHKYVHFRSFKDVQNHSFSCTK